jgi:DNA mismatch repair protein MutS
LVPYKSGSLLEIDEATRRSLEITRTIRTGNRDGSLLAVIDQTVTPMGSRLLADWVANPLTSVAEITARHDAVEELAADTALRGELRESLRGIYDLERLLARGHRPRQPAGFELCLPDTRKVAKAPCATGVSPVLPR